MGKVTSLFVRNSHKRNLEIRFPGGKTRHFSRKIEQVYLQHRKDSRKRRPVGKEVEPGNSHLKHLGIEYR